jgi:uncharacterized protein YcgL (UPF0745 family)
MFWGTESKLETEQQWLLVNKIAVEEIPDTLWTGFSGPERALIYRLMERALLEGRKLKEG